MTSEVKLEPCPTGKDEAAKRFAQWVNDGPSLAKAAGCYVGITISPLPQAGGEAK